MPNNLRRQELFYHTKLDHSHNFARPEIKKVGCWTTAGTFPTLMAILSSFGTSYMSQTRVKLIHVYFQLLNSELQVGDSKDMGSNVKLGQSIGGVFYQALMSTA